MTALVGAQRDPQSEPAPPPGPWPCPSASTGVLSGRACQAELSAPK